MRTRLINGGKENLVLSWSHFAFRTSAITSCSGIPFTESCNVSHGVASKISYRKCFHKTFSKILHVIVHKVPRIQFMDRNQHLYPHKNKDTTKRCTFINFHFKKIDWRINT